MDCGQLLIYYRGIWFLTTAGELRRLKILTVLSVWKHIGAVEEEFYSNFHFKIGKGYKVLLLLLALRIFHLVKRGVDSDLRRWPSFFGKMLQIGCQQWSISKSATLV